MRRSTRREAAQQRVLADGSKYKTTKRLGGDGDGDGSRDGGRDVEARFEMDLRVDRWHLYQCKHYASGLMPSGVFPEFAKFFRHLSANTYPRPAAYYLCAPHGVGNDLHNVLAASAHAFKESFLSAWENETNGMKGRKSELTAEVRAEVDGFDEERAVVEMVQGLVVQGVPVRLER